MGQIIDTKLIKEEIIKERKADLEKLKEAGITPTMVVIRIGNDPADIFYEKSIINNGKTFGIEVKCIALAETIGQDEVLKFIDNCNRDKKIHGIMLFRPLPSKLDEKLIINFVSDKKDIDSISYESVGRVLAGNEYSKETFPPCTAEAVVEILLKSNIELTGKDIVVIGRSLVVGKPLAAMLTDLNATVTLCHSKTKNLSSKCKNADILVSCMGKHNFIDDTYVNPNQIVIDVGINHGPDGKIAGDVNFQKVMPVVSAITPVPGGVGTVTSTLLMCHVIKAATNSI